MQEVYQINWKNSKKTAVAMGYFDGVHIGHKFLIDQMKQYAEQNNLDKAVFTFTKNITLGHKGKDILSVRQKVAVMQAMDIDLYYSPEFTVFAQLTPQQFVDDILIGSMGAQALFCGENFFFGKNRSGNVDVLKQLCCERGVQVFVVPTVELDDVVVSSTEIRKALENGDVEKANAMLGRPYSIDFEVVHGKQIGSKLGMPTINQIFPDTMCTPKKGVYITRTVADGEKYPSATGFGSRPTVNGSNVSCETTISGYSGNLYGKQVTVEFYSYLYPVQKFDTVQQLADMVKDVLHQSEKYNM